jgi:hypothetical protein
MRDIFITASVFFFGGIQQDDRGDRADRRANPEGPVDNEISPPADPCRDQLLDHDRGILVGVAPAMAAYLAVQS